MRRGAGVIFPRPASLFCFPAKAAAEAAPPLGDKPKKHPKSPPETAEEMRKKLQ